jgi:2'-5' RNA ligase
MRIQRGCIREDGRVADERGDSALVVPVPAAEPLVSSWRDRFDSSAAHGMPAHITALYPFLDEKRITASVIAHLSRLCRELPILDVEFTRTRRFPTVIYLDPEPAEGLQRLTTTIFEQWPEAPPFGGIFDEVIPHLTIGNGVDDSAMAAIDAEVLGRLPLRARLAEACLFIFDGARWQRRARFGFAKANVS